MSNRKQFRGIDIPTQNIDVARNLTTLDELTFQLSELQAIWNNLSLLGELTDIGADIGQTRHAFQQLANRLCNALIDQSLRKTSDELSVKAKNTIDLLVRNLFERTADIGFLSIDTELIELTRQLSDGDLGSIAIIKQRMRDYTAKYSVYDNVILLDKAGNVLVDMLDRYSEQPNLSDIAAEIRHAKEYWEYFGYLIESDKEKAIYYGWPLCADGSEHGYIILRFNLAQETHQLFEKILPRSEVANWIICGGLDKNNEIIFSSDTTSAKPGYQFRFSEGNSWSMTQIGANAYMAYIQPTSGYQGYGGPGWRGFALVPLSKAFDETHGKASLSSATQLNWHQAENILDPEFFAIQEQARQIQRQLNRSVWNGSLSQKETNKGLGDRFEKSLLWEISKAGENTRTVFADSLHDLLDTYISRLISQQTSSARLAIDIMDRNLYERANDCRWWALTQTLEDALRHETSSAAINAANDTLEQTNALYTVYHDIILINRDGTVIANSNPDKLSGLKIDQPWFKRALMLKDQQHYVVSDFEPSDLYLGKPTYIYAAALYDNRSTPSDAIGVIALVFDSEPQFEAILQESKANSNKCLAYIVSESGEIISSNTNEWISQGRLHRELTDVVGSFSMNESHGSIITLGEMVYAAGVCHSGYYREYKAQDCCYQNNLSCLYLMPLVPSHCAVQTNEKVTFQNFAGTTDKDKQEHVEIATFQVGRAWFGIKRSDLLAAITETNLASIPRSPSWVKGTMMKNGRLITIIDTAELIGTEHNSSEDRTLLLLKTPDGQNNIAIEVGMLGDIPNIPSEFLQTTELVASGHEEHFEAVIQADRELVLVINVQTLMTKIYGYV